MIHVPVVFRDTLIHVMAKGKIVDIGCHIGEMFGNRAVNVDINPLLSLRHEAKDETLVVPNFIQADAHHLPFNYLAFDCAILTEILEHVDDPLAVVNEAQRIAKIIYIVVPDEHEWMARHKPFQNLAHKRFFDTQSLKELLGKSEIQLIEIVKLWFLGWSHITAWGISKHVTEEIEICSF